MISLFCNHIIFSFPFFARIGSIEVFFVSYLLLWLLFFLSIGSLYRKRLAFRNFVLLHLLLFTIVPTGKGTGRNSYTICTGARWQFIHVSNINSIAIKSDSME